MNKEYVLDALAIAAPALGVLTTQLDANGFHIAWAAVVAALIGGLLAWSRTATGGFRS